MSFHKVMIPIITAAQWCLTVVDNYNKKIRQYDSMLTDDKICIYKVR